MARHDSILVSRTLYQIGVVTLVAAIMWVAIGVYTAMTKQPAMSVDKSLLEPITTTMDQEVITALMSRLKIEVDVIPENVSMESSEIQ
ncbi:MAG: hypothetical protein ABII21_02060 [bacterium]